MQLKNSELRELKQAVDVLGGGQFTFDAKTTHRIARIDRKLRGPFEDTQKAYIQLSKRINENKKLETPDPAVQESVDKEWLVLLEEVVDVDIVPIIRLEDLNFWEKDNKEGNKIPPAVLASLEKVLNEPDDKG